MTAVVLASLGGRDDSRAFPAPETGKIAVKVINHYGDEVMRVYGHLAVNYMFMC